MKEKGGLRQPLLALESVDDGGFPFQHTSSPAPTPSFSRHGERRQAQRNQRLPGTAMHLVGNDEHQADFEIL